MLTVSNLSIKVGSRFLLKDVSFDAKPGELTVIIGKNGAGKSTLLHTCTGDLKADEGNVQLDSRLLEKYDSRDIAKRRSVLSQQQPLNFPLKAKDVVLMGRYPHSNRFLNTEDIRIAQEMLMLTDTSHLSDQSYTTLSGGEKQRIHLARVLAQIWKPQDAEQRYLFLDEPTASLDIGHKQQLLELIKSLVISEKIVAVAVLHDLNLTSQFADKVILLKEGRLLETGKPAQVFNPELIEKVFDIKADVIPHPKLEYPLIFTSMLN
ncbi:MAG: heme ABC transporter ATP-binding protein [Calditrichota bacterium]